MLTKRMEIQAIADLLAGLPATIDPRYLTQPWLNCWNAIQVATPGKEHEAFYEAVKGLPDEKEIIQAVLCTRPGYVPDIKSLAEIGEGLLPIEWVWKGYIPRGLLTVLGASQGSGKSFVALDLAYRIIHNATFPDGSPIARPGANVIYVDAEAVPQITRERAQYYVMDQTKIYLLLPDPGEAMDLGQQKYQDRLTEMVAVLKPELIIIDSLSSSHSNGQNNIEDLRVLVGFYVRLAGSANCGVVLIHHIRKSPNGQRMLSADYGMEDLSGSGFITQQARVVLGLRVVQIGPELDPNGPRELKVLKSNLGAYPKSLGFTFEPVYPEGVRLKWDIQAPKEYREPTQLDLCKEWLEDTLKNNPEGFRPKELVSLGKEQGFGSTMIYRARRQLSRHITNTRGRQAPDNAWKWSDTATEPPEYEEDEE